MNRNKLIVLIVLLIAVVGLTMGSVSAKSMTLKKNGIKYIDRYTEQYMDFWQEGNKFYIYPCYMQGPHSEYKITKAKVYFKHHEKTKIKTYKANKWGNVYKKSVPKGYKLIKAKIYYKKCYNFL